MKVLWAPWRMDYVLGAKPDCCPFCVPQNVDEDGERLILYRGKLAFVLLNKFPYNNGHILVTPYRHVKDLDELEQAEAHELMDLLQLSSRALKAFCNPNGINIGVNMGQAAGAGIAEHLHFHLVPRWVGDSSFIAVMDEVRIVPQHLSKTYEGLLAAFKELSI